ncbi:uncharacterized protein LOC120667051 isoform X2 [Panicum virgatum]|uniref:Uncharacterized protein n=1 Tax=Panicum virgatum TaxID=38727 RepID=A0A8T0UPW3_PANVG|nr:uncharacterized protein LOC120667051 isoform X2 [Panicum virgatum]KAG2622359.1 hypothetical protein PVAP13_3NG268000 [Panicum virgatum]
MDLDQDSADEWVVLDSCTSDDDDDLVLALSSGCGTPDSATDSDSDSAAPAAHLLAAACATAADDADADAEGVYALSDAEDEYAYPPPSPPLPRPLAGLFHHTLAGAVSYAAFDPAAPGDAHHGAKQLVPDPTFASLIHEDAAALASTRGLVCLRGKASGDYYVANPRAFTTARLPPPARDHFAKGDPAVVITFDVDADADDADEDRARGFYRHYHVAVAFPMGEGIYAFESFSSRTGEWTIGAGVAAVETVVPLSGVAAHGCAFWRTTIGLFLCYEPVSGWSDLVPAPEEVQQWPIWELGEMEGTLRAICMDERVSAVIVIRLDFARSDANGGVACTLAGHFEGGCLRGRQDVTLLRSQGKAEVVMWDRAAQMVVAMDLEGRTTRTISFVPGTGYYADFIPYVSSLAAVSATGGRYGGTSEWF